MKLGYRATSKAVLAIFLLVAVAALMCWFCQSSPSPTPSPDGGDETGGESAPERAIDPQVPTATAPSMDAALAPDEAGNHSPNADEQTSDGAQMGEQEKDGEPPSEHSGGEDGEAWDGNWLTQTAMEEQSMATVSPTDADYDATIEAQQLFHAFEMDLRSEPLGPLRYKELLGRHKTTNAAALRRVMELNRAGHEAQGSQLYEEWSRLFELYRRRAYASQENRPAPDSAAPR